MSTRAEGPGGTTPGRRRTLAIVALWAIVMAAVSFGAGCYGRNCDGDTLIFGRNPGEGRLINADTWESGPIDGVWLAFPHQRVWVFDLHELGLDRTPDVPIAYVSAERDPLHENTNFTIGAGNIVEQSGADRGRITMKNGTCADYYLRVVVTATPRPPATIPVPADASTGD